MERDSQVFSNASRRRCPGCEGSTSVLLWRLTDRLFRTTNEQFSIYKCAECRLTFLWPVPGPDALRTYYPSGYWKGAPEAAGGVRHRATELYRRVMLWDHVRFVGRAIREHQRRGKDSVDLLDVGCGDGAFLSVLDHRPCAGLDFSHDAVTACQARGLEARQGTLEESPFEADRRFDVLTMFHFLEHVSPAGPTLQNARDCLKPGGELVIQVPNCSSIQAVVLGRYWAGYDVPRHLVNYRPDTLVSALERSGFEVVQITHYSIRDNPATLANSLAPGLYPPARAVAGPAVPAWQAWAADLAYFALSSICILPTLLEAACGRGAAVMVRARVRT